MTKSEIIRARIQKIAQARKAATQGEWLSGDWTIYDCDREAQRRHEPYWTLVDGDYLCAGPVGRKSLNPERIICGSGYECDGLDISKEDRHFIELAANESEWLTTFALEAVEALEEITEIAGYESTHTLYEKARGIARSVINRAAGKGEG